MSINVNELPVNVRDFQEKYQKIYGTGFFFSDIKGEQDHHKIIVLKTSQAKELQSLAKDCEVTSIEESQGEQLKIVDKYANLYTRPDADIKYLADQLNPIEIFRGLPSQADSKWVAVAVRHDFENVAPLELGWVLASDVAKNSLTSKQKPEKLMDLKSATEDLMGLPYFLAGKSFDLGYDCSGFTQTVIYRTRGLMLPRLSKWQALVGTSVDQESLATGDLMFFREKDMPISHVGIVMEPTGKLPIIIDSSVRNKGVAIEDLNKASWLGEKIQIAGYRRI